MAAFDSSSGEGAHAGCNGGGGRDDCSEATGGGGEGSGDSGDGGGGGDGSGARGSGGGGGVGGSNGRGDCGSEDTGWGGVRGGGNGGGGGATGGGGEGRGGTGGDEGGEGGREGGGMGGKIGFSTRTSTLVSSSPRFVAIVKRTESDARLDRSCCASVALPCRVTISMASALTKLVLVTATPLLAARLEISALSEPFVSERLRVAVPVEICNARTFATSTVSSLSMWRRELPPEASTQSGETR